MIASQESLLFEVFYFILGVKLRPENGNEGLHKIKKHICLKVLTINIFHCFFVFSWQMSLSRMLQFLKQASKNSYFVFFKFWIYCLLCMNTKIDCFKTITVVSLLCSKNMASLCITIKKFTLLSKNQRLFSPVLHY